MGIRTVRLVTEILGITTVVGGLIFLLMQITKIEAFMATAIILHSVGALFLIVSVVLKRSEKGPPSVGGNIPPSFSQ
jgi:hypothetical protein